MRFLVADDSTITRDFIVGCIRNDLGYRLVYEAANGQEAVELCRTHRPDIAILDINMEPLNGLEAAHIIKSEGLARHIVVATHARQALPKVRELGYDAQAKPFKREDLAAHLREVIRGPAH